MPWYDKAEATFTQIVDTKHTISSLYNMVNVPTGVWIDEDGTIVRPPEVAYTRDTKLEVGGRTLFAAGGAYVKGIRDWVANGADSEYVMTPAEIADRAGERTPAHAEAEAAFQLGVYFEQQGDLDRANRYWKHAQELRPESWNYHRQDWAFTPKEANKNWFQKFTAMPDEEPYYEPLEMPGAAPLEE